MLVNQIISDTSIFEEEKIQKILNRLIAEGHIKKPILSESYLFEVADYINVDGKFWVDYGSTEGGREMHQFNNERQAKRAVTDYNRTGRLTAGSNTKPIDAAAFQNKNTQVSAAEKQLALAKREKYFKVLKGGGAALRIILTVVALAGQYDEHVTAQADLYNNYLLKAYGEPGSPAAIKEFQDLSKALYGIWLSQIVLAIINAVAIAAIARKVILAIRSIITLGLVGTTGPFGLIVAWIGGEAISYGVLWLITRPSVINTIVQHMFNVPILQATFLGVASVADFATDGAATADLKKAQSMSPQSNLIGQGVAQGQKSNSTGTAKPAPSSSKGTGNDLLSLPSLN